MSSFVKTLTILEVSQKQNYIFSSNVLRENAERSADIAYVTSPEFFEELCGDLYRTEENLVNFGGGHTVLQFDGHEQASAFARKVTEEVLRRYDGLEIFVKQMEYDPARTPGDNLKELTKQLEQKKALRSPSFRRLSFGVEALREEDHAPRPVQEAVRPYREEPFSRLEPPGWQFPAQFEKLAGDDSFIAVVHIDGNAMGTRVNRVYEDAGSSWDGCCEKLRAFSRSIQESFEGAFRNMALRVAEEFPDRDGILPLRPVILAGDDVCFVSAGSIGLECSRIFLEELSRMKPLDGQAPYSACAGVAIVHTKFPFHEACDLAEELCSSAKRFGASLDPSGRISAMDWHIEYGQMKDSLQEIREDYETEDGNRLELRPVTVIVPEGCRSSELRDYGFVKHLTSALQANKDGVARSKVKELRTALKQGEKETDFYLHSREIQSLLYDGLAAEFRGERMQNMLQLLVPDAGGTRKPIVKDAFREIDPPDRDGRVKKRCLFFDAIEIMDHFTAFGEVAQ